MKDYRNISIFALGILIFLGACSKEAVKEDTNKLNTVDPPSETAETRECTLELSSATASKLKGFFGKVVSNLEGPATFCLTLNDSGSTTSLKGSLRIEYEDDRGIRIYKAEDDNTYFGTLTDDDDVEILFIDGAGLIQVKATDDGAGHLSGNIKYYNFPSYAEALQELVDQQKEKCDQTKAGHWTVAECLGYMGPNTNWWQMPSYNTTADLIAKARKIFNEPYNASTNPQANQVKTLSAIEFDLGDVLE